MAPPLTDGPVLPDLSDEQKIAWLQLIRSDNVGPVTFRDLINLCGSAEDAILQLPELLKKSPPRKKIKLCSRDCAEREFEAFS